MTINLPINGQVVDVHISKLIADPDQPRKTFAEDSLQALAASIAKSGVLVPLLVRRGEGDAFIIHDGERRLRAAEMAGLKTLPVIVTNASENLRFEQFAMNNLREHLKPMEIARMLADMQRKWFASANDLAAHLDRSGLPAMTPKQIDETIALVDLPDWLQGMIDAQQIEVPAALQVQTVAHLPEVLASVQEDIEGEIRMGGKATARDVDHIITATARAIGMDLSTDDWRSNPPHFNPKKVCKGCEFKLTAGRSTYCMNPPEFERKNAEAKAAGLLPGGKKNPAGGIDAEIESQVVTAVKTEQRAHTLQEKVRAYLHAYLVQRIVRFMGFDETALENLIDITDELLAWNAMRRPGESSYERRADVAPLRAAKELKIHALDDMFQAQNLRHYMNCAAIEVATELRWRETQVVCHQLWGSSIAKVWALDEAFLKLFRKAELLSLAADHALELTDGKAWDKLKLAELRTEIYTRANQMLRPKILQDLYETIEYDYVPSRYPAEEEDEAA